MKLSEYIEAIDGSVSAFAARAGVPISTVDRIVKGQVNCRVDVAGKIVRASRAHPTPTGGVVSFEDLIIPEATE